MSVATEPRGREAPAPPVDREDRLTVDPYLAMAAHGVIPHDARVELLEGRIVRKRTKKPPHILGTLKIFYVLVRAVPPGWTATKEDPIRLADSLPEPDCTIFRGIPEDYATRHDRPQDIALVDEAADTTSADGKKKGRIYAAASLPIYWLADLNRRVIEVHSDPTGPAEEACYRSVQVHGPGDAVPLVIEGREMARLAAGDLLP